MVTKYKNFYYNFPTQILFGEQAYELLKNNIKLEKSQSVLLVYGGDYVEDLPLLEELSSILSGKKVTTVSQAMVNPTSEYVDLLIAKTSQDNIDVVIAIGGGSVIDACKLYCLQYYNKTSSSIALDNREFGKPIIPLGVILTNPASGSESNGSFIIVNSHSHRKIALAHSGVRPVFAVCDFRYLSTLPEYQLKCSVCDIYAHLLEQFFSKESVPMLVDNLIIGAIKNLFYHTEILKKDFQSVLARENIMLNATFTLSYLLSMGKTLDWNVHEIEHSISGLYKSSHGASLSVIYPYYMRLPEFKDVFSERITYLGRELFGDGNIDSYCQKLGKFFVDLELGSSLVDTVGSQFSIKEVLPLIMNGRSTLGRVCVLEESHVYALLEQCCV